MKKLKRYLIIIVSLLLVLSWSQAFGQPGESEDRTLSPYFFVNSDNPDTDRLPLEIHIGDRSIFPESLPMCW